MRRRTQVRTTQWMGFAIWTILIAGMFFAVGRSSTPYKAINDLPSGDYHVQCSTQRSDGIFLTTVQNKEHDVTRIVAYHRPLPTTFSVIRSYKDHGRFKEHGYVVIDTTNPKRGIWWSNLRDRI